jgi:uncharacterized membrane protein HdeD (DUF308 family)
VTDDGWGQPAQTPVTLALGPAGAAGRSGHRAAKLLLGGASAVLGGLLVLWPDVSAATVAVLFGIQLLLHGVVRIVQSFLVGDSAGERVLLTLLGVLSVAAGVLCLRHPLQTVAALALLVGLFWLIGGLIEICRAVTGRAVRSWSDALSGLLGALAGLVVLCWPGPTVLVLTVLVGIWLLLFALLMIASALWAPSGPARPIIPAG